MKLTQEQLADLPLTCMHHSQCERIATWGTYRFQPGQTDVDLRVPARVWCGQHKIALNYTILARNVRIRRNNYVEVPSSD